MEILAIVFFLFLFNSIRLGKWIGVSFLLSGFSLAIELWVDLSWYFSQPILVCFFFPLYYYYYYFIIINYLAVFFTM